MSCPVLAGWIKMPMHKSNALDIAVQTWHRSVNRRASIDAVSSSLIFQHWSERCLAGITWLLRGPSKDFLKGRGGCSLSFFNLIELLILTSTAHKICFRQKALCCSNDATFWRFSNSVPPLKLQEQSDCYFLHSCILCYCLNITIVPEIHLICKKKAGIFYSHFCLGQLSLLMAVIVHSHYPHLHDVGWAVRFLCLA